MRNWFIATTKKKDEYYKGIKMHAYPDLHQNVISLVNKYLSKGKTVLDVGAGEGAFSQRLLDNSYQVTALDIDEVKWKAKDVPFRKLDINKPLPESISEKYDSVVCLEVAEHIENVWNLFREAKEMTVDDGIFFMSTPNVTSYWSRIYFLRSGYFHQFMPYDLSYGHINPLTFHEIETVAKNTGWEVVEVKESGFIPLFDFSEFKLPVLFANFFKWFFYLISKNYKKGWTLIYVFKKAK